MVQRLHKKVTGCELQVMNSKPKIRNTELETLIKANSEAQCLNCIIDKSPFVEIGLISCE